LLTVAGRDALAAADTVFYDALTHPALLAHCRPECERVFVGKRAEKHFVAQEDTNARIADAALAGRTVVRLKGGDPLVFGRGAEECAYLRERDVPFVVIPGVTSAIAALSYAGIPVTHRDVASSFAVITGHERGDRPESATRDGGTAEERRRWDRIAHAADTLVFLMGVESLSEIAARLIANGRDPQTPAALVQWGTWTSQRVVTGVLETIAQVAHDAGIGAPAVIVVGEVVRYRETLRWFDNRPLFGKRVLVTRAREQASALSAKLKALGAEPVEFPTIAIADPDDGFAALDVALRRLTSNTARPSWVVFTSANGVERTFQRLATLGADSRALGGVRVAAIGPGTAQALRLQGIGADFVPESSVAENLAETFPKPVAGLSVLLLQAAGARDALARGLKSRGARVTAVTAYRTLPAVDEIETLRADLAAGAIHAVTFTSGSTVDAFADALGESALPDAVRLVAIGPITADACARRLRTPDAVSDAATLDSLAAALCDLLG
jgi:uroporphyrinogen III methyltransferase/synthase